MVSYRDKKIYCPVCGRTENVEFIEGGTEWTHEELFICEKCEVGFAIGYEDYVKEILRNKSEPCY